MSEAIYIVSGARTPMGGLMGDLATVPATELGSTAIRAAVERASISAASVDAYPGPRGRRTVLGASLRTLSPNILRIICCP